MALGLQEELSCEQVRLTQSIITNGTLLGRCLNDRFFTRCGIRTIQISMDGYGDEGILAKGFLEPGCSYEDILCSIEACLVADFSVSVRLNLSSKNENSLAALAKELQARFCNFENLYIYPAPLYGHGPLYLDVLSACAAIQRLEQIVMPQFTFRRSSDSECFDNNTFVIQPDGNVLPCEHLYRMIENYLGNVTTGVFPISLSEMTKTCSFCPNVPICKQGCEISPGDERAMHKKDRAFCWRGL